MMQTVRWITFGISNALTKSVVHFFPSEGNVTAPYQVTCALTLFAAGVPEKRVVLEGARMSSPDGVRLDDAFPVIQEQAVSLFGVSVELSSAQPRVDLSPSSCIVELAARGSSARFWPPMVPLAKESGAPVTAAEREQARAKIGSGERRAPYSAAPVIQDCFQQPSLVIVNMTSAPHRPEIGATRVDVGASGQEQLGCEALALSLTQPMSVVEMPLEQPFFSDSSVGAHAVVECSWGLTRIRGIGVRETPPPGIAYFLLYRDVLTRRPLSVCAL